MTKKSLIALVLCTYVVELSLVMLFDSIASQADDVTGLEAAVPADTYTVPQHHPHIPCPIVHLQHRLKQRERENSL